MNYDLTLYTYLAPSKVCGGVGVFSLRDIPKDTIIWKEKQKVVKVSWDEISNEISDYVCSMTWNDDDGFYLDCDLDRMYQAYYVNHSDNPNVDVYDDQWYIAIRDIKKGEELLYRYSEDEKDWT